LGVLKLDGFWVWDSWYVFDGTNHHAFYLKAPKSLGDPELRHRHPAVGHAISTDLINWSVLNDAISPSAEPAFDSWTTWTGSVIKDDGGTWWMFYTGTAKADGGDIQRIGAAKSTDLIAWQKVSTQALVEADPKYYELFDSAKWHDQAWRDPWVFKHDDRWQMLITARANSGEKFSRGVVGHAVSEDLLNWQVLPPLTQPNAGFGQLEVLQVANIDGTAVLIWCCGPAELSAELRTKYPTGGMFSVIGDSSLGPFDLTKAVWFPHASLYAARLVQHQSNWYLIGFTNQTASGFGGVLIDPIAVKVSGNGLIPYI
jgi:beta-fructofuranosidase